MAYPSKPLHAPKVLRDGTELPLIDLKGKPYMQVAYRLVWFRSEHPDGIINDELIANDTEKGVAIAKSTILLYSEKTKTFQVVSTGYKMETRENFSDYLEKAFTGAQGRALAVAGYGTQFDPTLDEGDRLADAPIQVPVKNASKKQPQAGPSHSNRADEKSSAPVQAIPRATITPASQVSDASGESTPGFTPPKASNRKEVNSLLSSLARSIIAKKLADKNTIESWMQDRYGSSKKEGLSDAAAEEFLLHLQNVNNGQGIAQTVVAQA